MTEPHAEGAVLFAESGASWWWLLAGPSSALAMLGVQLWSGAGIQWVVPVAFLVLVTSFVSLQIKAARIHTSVELTAETLRQGTETTLVEEIVAVYPEPRGGQRSYSADRRLDKAGGTNALTSRALRKAGIDLSDLEESDAARAPESPEVEEARRQAEEAVALVTKWQAARALGELTGVPRGRTGIGLKLSGGGTAQAWARRHRELRAALSTLVDERGANA
jgi:hypothetical protein